MKRLHWFIIKSFLGPFFMTLLICIFVLMMQLLFQRLNDIVGKGLDAIVIAEMMWYMVLSIIPMALPLAMLLASLMTFGNLGEYYELTAIKAAGVSLTRAMRPLIVFAIMLTCGAFAFSNYVMPIVNTKMYALIFSIRNKNPETVMTPGVFMNDFTGYTIKVDDVADNGMLHQVMIYDHTRGNSSRNNCVIMADSGRIQMTEDLRNVRITLHHGTRYEEGGMNDKRRRRVKTHPFATDRFDKQVMTVPLEGFELNRMDEKSMSNHYKMLNIKQLEVNKDSIDSAFVLDIKKFIRNLEFNSYWTRHLYNEIRPDSIKQDLSYFYTDSVSIFRHDTIFTEYDKKTRIQILDNAIREARGNVTSLSGKIRMFYDKKKILNMHGVYWHKKFTWSLACLLFFFIGAPLGAIIRKGGLGMPVVVSIFMFIFYYIITTTFEKFAREGSWGIWYATWMTTFIFAPLGVFLTYKSANDSSLMSSEMYIGLLKKFMSLFRKKKADENTDSKQ